MPHFIDYKEEVKRILSESYIAADLLSKEFEMSTADIYGNLQNLLPKNSIDEYVVYEALMELGFQPKETEPLKYFWYFKRL
jgi:hypothetical protein